MKPLFMWAGGKKKMIKHYEPLMPKNIQKYVEPFFGGGAMFVHILENNQECKEFVINDINGGVIEIYRAIKNDLHSFLNYLDLYQKEYISLAGPNKIPTNKTLEKKHKVGKRKNWKAIFDEQPSRRHFYFMMRDVHAFDYKTLSKTNEAALLYFLMKTGFNGVWQVNKSLDDRFGTPCGLLNHKDVVYDLENVKEWSKHLQNVDIRLGDYGNTLKDVNEETFVFLDPPYRGCFTDYGTKSDDQFQEEVIEYFHSAREKGAVAFLCNRDLGDNFFEERKKDSNISKFDVSYTVGRRRKKEDGTFEEAKKAVEILMH
jgi:DNA adenine methylase